MKLMDFLHVKKSRIMVISLFISKDSNGFPKCKEIGKMCAPLLWVTNDYFFYLLSFVQAIDFGASSVDLKQISFYFSGRSRK